MMRAFLLLIFIAAVIAGVMVYREPKRLGLDRWAVFSFLDHAITSSTKLRESRLSSLLDEKSGSCEARSGVVQVKVGEQWKPADDTKTPFGEYIKLAATQVLGVENNIYVDAIRCRDSLGNEFRIRQPGGQIVLRLDRAAATPIRVSLLSIGNVRLAGKNLNLLLHSPLGDLSLRSLANTEINVDITGGQDLNLASEGISVRDGKVHVERISKEPLGADVGMVRLSAEKDGQLQWEDEKQIVIEGRSATVLPSGLYWEKPSPQPIRELSH